jgi:hypothetical protein
VDKILTGSARQTPYIYKFLAKANQLADLVQRNIGALEGFVRRLQVVAQVSIPAENHEAFWNTGGWAPPNYIAPDPPITDAERAAFSELRFRRRVSYTHAGFVFPPASGRQSCRLMRLRSFTPANGSAMAICPASEDPRSDERSSHVIRNVKVHGHRTSVRL